MLAVICGGSQRKRFREHPGPVAARADKHEPVAAQRVEHHRAERFVVEVGRAAFASVAVAVRLGVDADFRIGDHEAAGPQSRMPADAIIAFQRAEREGAPVLAIDAEPAAGRLLPHRREDHPTLPAVRVFEGAFGAIHAAALNQFDVVPVVESGEVPEQ